MLETFVSNTRNSNWYKMEDLILAHNEALAACFIQRQEAFGKGLAVQKEYKISSSFFHRLISLCPRILNFRLVIFEVLRFFFSPF